MLYCILTNFSDTFSVKDGFTMIYFLVFAAVAIFLVADILLAKEFYKIAVMKGWSSKKYFWFPVLVTFAGYLLVIALPDKGRADSAALVSDDLPEL